MKFKGFEIRSHKEQADIDVINEVCVTDTYKLQLLNLPAPAHVFDIGAHIGTFLNKVDSLYPKESIIYHCFEADPENYDLLKKNTKDMLNVTLNGALTTPGFNVMTRAIESTGGGNFRDSVPTVCPDFIQGQTVEIIDATETVDYSYFDLKNRKGSIWMKLDCEGSEFGILPQIPDIQKIDFLVGEYHHNGDAFKRMIMGFFGNTHYFIKKCWVKKTLGDIIGNFWLFRKEVTDIRIFNKLETELKN